MGKTKGFTCKRVPGKEKGVFVNGKRVWDKLNLRPKLIYARLSWEIYLKLVLMLVVD